VQEDRSPISRILLRRQRRSQGEPAAIEATRLRELSTRAWGELLAQVRQFGLGLRALGVERGQVVGILAPAGPEATIVVLGALLVGVVVADLGDGTDLELSKVALCRADCRLAICGEREHAEALLPILRQRGIERGLIGWGAASSVNAVFPFGQVCLKGNELAEREPVQVTESIASVRNDDLAIVMPDSRRDGSFREVRLTHDNCIVAAESLRKAIGVQAEDRILALGTSRGLLEQLLLALVSGLTGASLLYAVRELGALITCQSTRPTIVLADKNALDELHRALDRELLVGAAWRRRISAWALWIGNESARRRISGAELGPLLTARQLVADYFVLAELRRLIGGQVRRLIVPGANSRREARWFFEAFGVSPLGIVGPAEASGIGLMELPDDPRPGSYGRAMPGVDVWVDAEGRVRIRGANVSKQAPHIDARGWLDLDIIADIDDEGMIWPESPMGSLDASSLAVLPIAEPTELGPA